MEGHLSPIREDLYRLQMDIKHVQAVQTNQADRIFRLERRQADDAALKSVWNSPFPGMLNRTPQQGLLHATTAEVFDGLDDEHSHTLLGSLHIDAEEPARRGASRANSVRFDVSATQGSNWAQSSRGSAEFGPGRPNSGFGGHSMERTLSHKSDGRHSSAGHSIRSVYSAPSGRTSSLGLDTHFMVGVQDDPSPSDIPEPPPGLFILGNVPCIIRCWLNENFSHGGLLYANVCTGSNKSTLDHSLIKALGLVERVRKDSKGHFIITLPVYLPEAVLIQPSSRTSSPVPHLPALTVNFEVTSIHQHVPSGRSKAIRIFLGSDTLRAHSADLLLSQNAMTLYGDGRDKLSVPFVRPEDELVFNNLYTVNIAPEDIGLKETVLPITRADRNGQPVSYSKNEGYEVRHRASSEDIQCSDVDAVLLSSESLGHISKDTKGSVPDQQSNFSPRMGPLSADNNTGPVETGSTTTSIHVESREHNKRDLKLATHKAVGNLEHTWGSWRSAGLPRSDGDGSREIVSASGYNKPSRSNRSMKVLKPSKVLQNGRSTSGARHVYEPSPSSPLDNDTLRRKGQITFQDDNSSTRWKPQKISYEDKAHKEPWPAYGARRPSNPIGGASAFAWMKAGDSKADLAMTE